MDWKSQIARLEGTKLDVAIERVVFNRYRPEDKEPHCIWENQNDLEWWVEIPDFDEDGEWCRSWTEWTWPPAHHISAFSVVDKMIARGYSFKLLWIDEDNGWLAQFLDASTKAYEKTRPLAICRAALYTLLHRNFGGYMIEDLWM